MRRRWFLGLGANLGDARRAIERTLERLTHHPAIERVRISSLWKSAPIDAEGPDFINAVVVLESDLAPGDMLAFAHSLEALEHRRRSYRNAPRTLDIDLLLADEQTVDSAELTLPHPRMHLRAFVLAPLLELDPHAHIPGRGLAADWLLRCSDQRLERLSVPHPPETSGDRP